MDRWRAGDGGRTEKKSVQRKEFMLGAVEAAHARVGLGPDDEIGRAETELLGGCDDRWMTPPIDEGAK
jgi:hypothetical protein